LVVAVWGLNYTVMKYVLTHGFAPLTVTSLRWTLAAVSFLLLAWRIEGGLRVTRGDAVRLTVLGFLGVTVTQISNVYSISLAPAATVSIVFGLLPVVMAVLARIIGVERLSPLQWLGVAASCAGVALIALGRGGDLGGDLLGILLAVGTVTGFGVYSVLLVPIAKRTSPLTVNAVSLAVPALALLVISSPQLARQDWSEPNGLAWAGVAFAGLGAIVLGNGLWFVALRRVGPGRGGVYANLQPVFGVLFAVWLLSESLHPLELVGAAAIALGIVLARRRRGDGSPRSG
jgi:drug/metabolite transporter (DMT)-like permease